MGWEEEDFLMWLEGSYEVLCYNSSTARCLNTIIKTIWHLWLSGSIIVG